MKYPIGTKWFSPSPTNISVTWWELLYYVDDEMSMFRANDGFEADFPNDIFDMGDPWIIEYPKERLFDQLYERMQSR